jgi:flagellar hook-basal body complex protein FliE
MTIQRVTVRPIELGLTPELPPEVRQPGGQENKFDSILGRFMSDVNDVQARASQVERQALEGTVDDIHQVMIAAEEAGIAFEMLVELRNKLLEAYHELMRMQV